MAANLLTDSAIKVEKCPIGQKLTNLNDGEGLTLEVMPTGAKLWRYRYRFNGKQNRLSLGKYPEVSLKSARLRRDEANKQVAEGRDPSQVRKTTKRMANGTGDTFAEIAAAMIKVKAGGWSQEHLDRTNSLLKRDLLPSLGHRMLTLT